MKDRIQVADLQQATLRPSARPVDTYYRPQEPIVEKPIDPVLAELASGLGKMQPQLVKFATDYLDKKNKEDQAAGNEAYRAALLNDQDLNKKAWKDLVDQGVVPAGISPWFEKGWREQQLRVMGDDFGRELTLAWNSNGDLKGTDDPGKLNQFIADQQLAFREKVKATGIEYRPAELVEVLDPIIDHYGRSVAGHHVQYRMEERQKEVEANTGVEVGRLAIRSDMSPEDRAGAIQSSVNSMVSSGLSGTRATAIITDAVVNAAVANKDAGLLSVLGLIKSGTAPVGSTNYAKAKIQEAQQSIQRMQEHEQQWQWSVEEHEYQKTVARPRAEAQWQHSQTQWKQAQEEHDRVKEERALYGSIASFIAKDPSADYRGTKEFKRLLELDPMKAEHMGSFHRQWILGTEEQAKEDDKGSYVSLMRDIYTNPAEFDANRLERSFLDKQITKATYQQLHEDLRRAKSDQHDPLTGSREFTDLVDAVKKGIAGSPDGMFGVGGYNAELGASQFRGWARDYVARAKAEGKPVSASEFIFEAQKKGKEIATQYNPELSTAGRPIAPPVNSQDGNTRQEKSQPPVMPIDEAIKYLISNPTPEVQAHFEKTYGRKASDYVR